MPHYKTMIDTTYLGSWDFPPGKHAIVVIESVERYVPERKMKVKKRLPDGREVKIEEPNKRLKISFRGKKKAWLAGPVSQKTIATLFGPDTDAWIGKPIEIYVDPDVEFAGIRTGGVRVLPRKPQIGQASADTLSRPVDEVAAQRIADAKATTREPGEEG
jgi:hypothetical protein